MLFNDLHFEPGESINSFVERMIQKQLVLEGLGKVLSEDVDMTERFKAAVIREKSMKELCAVLQVIPNFNWWSQVLAMFMIVRPDCMACDCQLAILLCSVSLLFMLITNNYIKFIYYCSTRKGIING